MCLMVGSRSATRASTVAMWPLPKLLWAFLLQQMTIMVAGSELHPKCNVWSYRVGMLEKCKYAIAAYLALCHIFRTF